MTSSKPASNWAGKRLGLPESGPGSLAKMGKRTLAILIDWGLSMLVSQAFFGGDPTATLLIYGLQQWILVATLGAGIGHTVMRLRVARLDGKWVGPWRSLLRIALILLVIPAVVWDNDNRGLHDKAAGTVLVLR
ncbi:RDD family protein [Rhodoluna sp.]|uniref:RDD family protein n=1 Tax=Rhodoluna sp. TaxID=1969481 RepID=UPI0025F34815|nr:RDD family protein [Rhodoluna sp.]